MFDSEKKNTDVPTDSPAVVPEADEPYAAVDQGAWRRGGDGKKKKRGKEEDGEEEEVERKERRKGEEEMMKGGKNQHR